MTKIPDGMCSDDSMNHQITDKEILDWLDKQTGQYTGRVIFRRSFTDRGWRLHETAQEPSFRTVREAILHAMKVEREK